VDCLEVKDVVTLCAFGIAGTDELVALVLPIDEDRSLCSSKLAIHLLTEVPGESFLRRTSWICCGLSDSSCSAWAFRMAWVDWREKGANENQEDFFLGLMSLDGLAVVSGRVFFRGGDV